MHETIRVVLADDHQILRDGLRILIEGEPDMTVVGEAESGEDALNRCQQLHPDVIIMDLGMPGMNGLSAIRELRKRDAPCKIVVLSMHSDRELILQAMKTGADGFVPKSTAHHHLLEAIRAVHSGERYLHPTAASALVDVLTRGQREGLKLENLSARERQVVRLTALGYTSREIGEKIALSPKTVDTYRQRAMVKLNLEQRSELVQFALRAGLLDESGDGD